MSDLLKFLIEEKESLTKLIVEYVTNDYNPQKLIDKKNYIEQLIKKATNQKNDVNDSDEVDFNRSNISINDVDDSLEDTELI